MKEELLKITGDLKVYLQNTDKTLCLDQCLDKNEVKISGKAIDSSLAKKAMVDKSILANSAIAHTQIVKTKESSMIKEKKKSTLTKKAMVDKPSLTKPAMKDNPSVAKKAMDDKPADAMKSMFTKVQKCKKCMLGLSRLNPVFGMGNVNADVIFVAEGPGFNEDHTGEPFVGRSGELLDKIFASIDLSRETVYITNIVKCHPMVNPETPEAHGNDRPPTPEEISICRHYLEEQIKIIKPKCIVTLGSVASKLLLGEKRGISLLRGKWHDAPSDFFTISKNIKILPMYHPAALLRNSNLKKDTWSDMKMLRDFLKKKK